MKKKQAIKATIYNKRGELIATGFNSYIKTHPQQARYARQCGQPDRIYLHAEVAALVKMRTRGYRIVIERYNNKGEPMNAQPCPVCQLAIKTAGISRIEYTIKQPLGSATKP